MDRAHSIAYINNNPEQFIWCNACDCFNHIDNKKCHNCSSRDMNSRQLNQRIDDERNYLIYSLGMTEESLREESYTVR